MNQSIRDRFRMRSIVGASIATFFVAAMIATNAAVGVGKSEIHSGPLALPQAVIDTCNDSGMKAGACVKWAADLAEFANDARDPVWASKMEEGLQAYVETNYKRVLIRNIDCRTSWCAIEVDDTEQSYLGNFPYQSPFFKLLIRQNWMWGKENGDRDIMVVLFKRWHD